MPGIVLPRPLKVKKHQISAETLANLKGVGLKIDLGMPKKPVNSRFFGDSAKLSTREKSRLSLLVVGVRGWYGGLLTVLLRGGGWGCKLVQYPIN